MSDKKCINCGGDFLKGYKFKYCPWCGSVQFPVPKPPEHTETVLKPGSILDEAARIVYGDREKTYGKPESNTGNIAAIWSVILGVPVTAEQVCLCMMGVKLARLANSIDHRDSLVDLAGYAAILERIQNSKKTNQVSNPEV